MKLYELNKEIETLMREVEEAGGELTPDIEAKLDSLAIAKEEKVFNIAFLIKEAGLMAHAIHGEVDRLKARARVYEAREQRLRNYLLSQLHPGEKYANAQFSIRTQTSQKVMIHDEEAVPNEFFRLVRRLDVGAVREKLENGAVVAGAELVTNRYVRLS